METEIVNVGFNNRNTRFITSHFTSWLDSFYPEYDRPLFEPSLLSLLLFLVFTIGSLAIGPLYSLSNQLSTSPYIQPVSSVAENTEGLALGPLETDTNADAELKTVFGYQLVLTVQNTLVLFFLGHSFKEKPKSENSFRICESQFEKHCPSLFQVVIDFWKTLE